MKFEHTKVFNFIGAIRGMRNPMDSWDKSDSAYCLGLDETFALGKKDKELAQKLIKAGPVHRKFMRQIMISVDITAPLYFWKEFSTYKVGTTANSCSTMHRLAVTPITMDCFEMSDFAADLDADDSTSPLIIADYWRNNIIWSLEYLRKKYLETKDKRYWKELIRLLPESWLQKRTVTMSYENILSIVKWRKDHKLTEWSVDFMNWVKTLPYADELLLIE